MSDAWTPSLMMQVKRVGTVHVSQDGARVAFAVREAVMQGETSEFRTQLHLADSQGGPSRPLTQGDKSHDEPQWSPDGSWIACLSNRSGKKNVWLLRADGGEPVQLTDMKTDVACFKWSPNGRALALVALDPPTAEEDRAVREKNDAKVVDENVKRNRLYLVNVGVPPTLDREPRPLTPTGINIYVDANRPARGQFDWSPDGKHIAFAHSASPHADDWGTANLSVLEVAPAARAGDRATAEPAAPRSLLSSKAVEASPLYSPDGKWLAYTLSDSPPTWAGTRSVCVLDLTSGESRTLAPTQDGFGRYSELIGWSEKSDRIFFTETHGTNLTLMALPLAGQPHAVAASSEPAQVGMALGGITLNARRTHFGFGWEQLDQPSEAFVRAVDGSKPTRVSQVHHKLPRPTLGKSELARWRSKDGLEIEGIVTYPVGYAKGKRYPLLLVIHGGPMGVFTQQFDGAAGLYPIAAFASRGYVLLRANVRGSSGYGKKFRYANYNDWGGGDYQDLMAGVDHLIEQGVADPQRLGVMGWSYGGYMTSWIITQTKRFQAASVGAGVTNLVSFTGTSDIPGFLPDYFHGEYWGRDEVYRKHSPMFQVKGVTTPTLIQHGERDERVPLPQGQELYNALKRQGCPTKMVLYPRTPHGIEEPRLMLDCMTRNLDWFDRYVGASK